MVTTSDDGYRNEVILRGRLSSSDEPRALPSGDELLAFRVVVERPPPRPATGVRASVDTIDCQTTRPALMRTIARLRPGDVIEVEGALRRRFWQGPAGRTSRYGVEVRAVRKVKAVPGGRPGRGPS